MTTATASTYELDPLFYDAAPTEEDASYDRWFRSKVQEAIDSKKPCIPHDEVVREMAFITDSRRKIRADA